MMLSFFTRRERGFTLTEVTLISAIIGVFAAIAAPSFLSWLNRQRTEDVLAQVEGALKEARAEAVKIGRICEVDLGVAQPNTITAKVPGTTENCLPTGGRDLSKLGIRVLANNDSGVDLATNMATLNGNTIQFSPRGTTTSSNLLVFFEPGKSGRCLAISNGLGLVRRGTYAAVVDSNNLQEALCEAD
jgi:Tfp pilus assembly protein FimT